MNPINPPRYTFQRIRRWMQTAIMHPDGVEEGMNSPAAHEEIDIAAAEAEQVVTRSKALDGRGAAVDLRQRLLRPTAGVHEGGVPSRNARPR